MLNQTSGDALINGKSIKTEMSSIRASLGICPQFDVLWPTLTVKEHLAGSSLLTRPLVCSSRV